MPAYLGPDMSVVNRRYFPFWHNHGGRLYIERISTWGTTSHGLGRSKEGSAMTRPTIQKISEDHDMLPKA
jgi:hypothetical protein